MSKRRVRRYGMLVAAGVLAVSSAVPIPSSAGILDNQCFAKGAFHAQRIRDEFGSRYWVYAWRTVSGSGMCRTPLGLSTVSISGRAVNFACEPSATESPGDVWGQWLVTVTVTPPGGPPQKFNQYWTVSGLFVAEHISMREWFPAPSVTVFIGGPTGEGTFAKGPPVGPPNNIRVPGRFALVFGSDELVPMPEQHDVC